MNIEKSPKDLFTFRSLSISEAIGEAAYDIRKGIISDLEDDTSLTFGEWRQKSLKLLQETYLDCSIPDWDGHSAAPISPDAYIEAKTLLDNLPSTFPLPDIIPEPDGSIALEWRKDNKHIFIISLSGTNVLLYAGILGTSRVHGSEHFTGIISAEILQHLRKAVQWE